jgi:hypothetical protein
MGRIPGILTSRTAILAGRQPSPLTRTQQRCSTSEYRFFLKRKHRAIALAWTDCLPPGPSHTTYGTYQ